MLGKVEYSYELNDAISGQWCINSVLSYGCDSHVQLWNTFLDVMFLGLSDAA